MDDSIVYNEGESQTENSTVSDGEDVSSLLVVILDTNPVWWGKQILKHGREIIFSQYLNAVMVFANSHLLLSHRNRLAIIAAHIDSSQFLYPAQESRSDFDEDGEDVSMRGDRDGKYELFAQMNKTIRDQIKDLILTDTDMMVSSDSLVAGAMAMALCYINRIEKEAAVGEKISSRILVIKGSEDNPSQYMNLMNVIFTAQKQNVAIDACLLDEDSGLLQQACDISGGLYLKLPQTIGILQYLLWAFLPDPSTRKKLALPPKVQVDYRAACFCHRNLIDIGYVCSVCLSVFCSFSPICSTCHTTFKLPGPPQKMMKKKSRKSLPS